MSGAFIAHISTVIIPVTKISSRNANVGAVTFGVSRLTCAIGFKKEQGKSAEKYLNKPNYPQTIETFFFFIKNICIALGILNKNSVWLLKFSTQMCSFVF